MGPSAEVHCAARAAERVQRSRNAFSSITMTKPVACRGTPLYFPPDYIPPFLKRPIWPSPSWSFVLGIKWGQTLQYKL